MNKDKNKLLYLSLIIIFLIFSTATLITDYYGETDTRSFTSTGKFFAGEYPAKIRSSHSYLWGFVNAPLLKLFQSFIAFKILNLIVLALIIISVYYISGKHKHSLLILLFTPIIWYMAPYINSIQIASLFFLWAYYFIEKYDREENFKCLMFSGLFFGLAAAFWHAIFFFGIFLIIIYFYNKKVTHLFTYLLLIWFGLLPLLVLDHYIFGFMFHSLIKNTIGTMSNLLSLGIYSVDATASKTFETIIPVIIMIPIYFWKLYEKENFKKYWKSVVFITISLLIIFKNPQVRYLLLIVPIILILLFKILNKKQLRRLLFVSGVITIMTIVSFLVISMPMEHDRTQDLIKIAKDYPNETFVVYNWADNYERLAVIYWGDDIKELVSNQDYSLYIKNDSILIERELRFTPNVNGRREFWISAGIGKSSNDNTDYESIKYAINYLPIPLTIENFIFDKKYEILSVYKKQDIIYNNQEINNDN